MIELPPCTTWSTTFVSLVTTAYALTMVIATLRTCTHTDYSHIGPKDDLSLLGLLISKNSNEAIQKILKGDCLNTIKYMPTWNYMPI